MKTAYGLDPMSHRLRLVLLHRPLLHILLRLLARLLFQVLAQLQYRAHLAPVLQPVNP